MVKVKKKMGYAQLLALGFMIVIVAGTFLLSLPISSKSREWTDLLSSLFTATSATCVTGLVVFDTYTHFSLFGQIVIIILIQIGGLGFMSMIAMISLLLRRKINFHERKMLMQSAGAFKLNGITTLIQLIVKGTFLIEGIGAILLSIRFIPMYGVGKGIYYAIFHSISAFCNAGFDLMGGYGEYSSLVPFYNDKLVILTISFLIISGGIGFLVWNDIVKYRFNIKKYELHSKVALLTSAVLIFGGWAIFFILEYNNPGTLKDMSLGDKLLNSFFQSVTTRTAGFNAIDQTQLSNGSLVLTIALMFIGGSSCSTAGGVKTTTIAVIVLNAIAAARDNRAVEVYQRRFDDKLVKQACAIITIYILLVIFAALIIMPLSQNSGFDLGSTMYVIVSAIGTVGLAMVNTSALGIIPKIILIILMYVGRIGGLTLALSFNEKRAEPPLRRPAGKIVIG